MGKRSGDMDFEKFTERTRGFIESAQGLALRSNHQQLTPEHLLKVLLDDEEGMASNLPKTQGGSGQVYLAPETARTFDQAQELAKKAGDSYVTAERLLQALAMTPSAAANALKKAGVTPQALNKAIEDLRQGRTADSATAENSYEALKKYSRDLTETARAGKLDPVIGRDEEIRRTIQVLARRTKNNPVLIGEPGVGKTAIVEGLANRIVHCVGATTLDEYRKHVEKDAALARRFQPIFVAEPTVEDTISILRGLKEKY